MIIKNVIEKLPKHDKKSYSYRPIKAIKYLAVHHSLTDDIPGGEDIYAFARYHVNDLGWPGIGYTYVIDVDGIIYKTNPAILKTYHVGDYNYYALGICLVGDFRNSKPTKDQYEALIDLLEVCSVAYDTKIKNIWGHNEFPGYSWKHCPEIDMDMVRKDVYLRFEESDETWKVNSYSDQK